MGAGALPRGGRGPAGQQRMLLSFNTPLLCFRGPTCSPSGGTTPTSRTSPSSWSTPSSWSAPLRGLSCRARSRGTPTPCTTSPHSTRPQWWRGWGPWAGCSHCRGQTQESQQGEGAGVGGGVMEGWDGPELAGGGDVLGGPSIKPLCVISPAGGSLRPPTCPQNREQ